MPPPGAADHAKANRREEAMQWSVQGTAVWREVRGCERRQWGCGSKSQTNALFSNGCMSAPNNSLYSVLAAYCIAVPDKAQAFA